MFLKYYRAESDAWKDTVNCEDCVEHHKAVVEPFHSCDLSTDCTCKICVRQPPTLADSASHVLFNYTLHLDSFKLTIEKTYSQYVFAVRSNRVPQDSLLPPETPLSVCGSNTKLIPPTNITTIVRVLGRGILIL